MKTLIKYSEIPSKQEFPTIKIKSLTAKNKAKNYDDTMAYFVAAIKYDGRWYTQNSTSINGREIGPGTVIISTLSEMKKRKRAAGQNPPHTIWRHLIADFLDIETDLYNIERIGLLEVQGLSKMPACWPTVYARSKHKQIPKEI